MGSSLEDSTVVELIVPVVNSEPFVELSELFELRTINGGTKIVDLKPAAFSDEVHQRELYAALGDVKSIAGPVDVVLNMEDIDRVNEGFLRRVEELQVGASGRSISLANPSELVTAAVVQFAGDLTIHDDTARSVKKGAKGIQSASPGMILYLKKQSQQRQGFEPLPETGPAVDRTAEAASATKSGEKEAGPVLLGGVIEATVREGDLLLLRIVQGDQLTSNLFDYQIGDAIDALVDADQGAALKGVDIIVDVGDLSDVSDIVVPKFLKLLKNIDTGRKVGIINIDTEQHTALADRHRGLPKPWVSQMFVTGATPAECFLALGKEADPALSAERTEQLLSQIGDALKGDDPGGSVSASVIEGREARSRVLTPEKIWTVASDSENYVVTITEPKLTDEAVNAPAVGNAFSQLAELQRDVILDFSRVNYIAEDAVVKLSGLHLRFAEKGHQLILCGLGAAGSSQPEDTLYVKRLHRELHTAHTVEDAMQKKFRSPDSFKAP